MFTVYKSANGLTNPQSEGTSGGFLHVPGGLAQWSLFGERQWCVPLSPSCFLRRAAPLTPLAQQG